MHRTAFEHAFGGPRSTGGRAAVALRFDHGLTNFARFILPLVAERGITVSIAHNPRNFHLPENRGVTPEELNDWVREGHVEIWNHSASHQAIRTSDDLYDQIVTSLAEIEAQLPAARGRVWGYNPPGVPGHDYAGFNNGSRPEHWATSAGRLILAHHAVASGHLPGTTQRLLDGRVRDGLAHVTLDARPISEVAQRLEVACRKRRGLQLMLHPSRLGMEGKISPTEFASMLEHIVQLRADGRLVTLSPYELLLADSRPPGARA